MQGHDDRYVHLDLSAGYRWGAELYADGAELALALPRWMEREIASPRRRAPLEVL